LCQQVGKAATSGSMTVLNAWSLLIEYNVLRRNAIALVDDKIVHSSPDNGVVHHASTVIVSIVAKLVRALTVLGNVQRVEQLVVERP
jgi:hypothetical protein